MGYNISGLVIDKNYENDIEQIENILGEKLTFDKKVDFESGSENWKDDNYCDIYFSEKGTLIFISMERAASEMTMTFAVNYTDNCKIIRSFAETEDEVRHEEIGEKLDFEKTENDASELIHHLIEKTLDKKFWDIDLEEECYRYNFKSQTSENTPEKEEKIEPDSIKERKPWWKFW